MPRSATASDEYLPSGHVVIKGRPCKIIDMSTSKTGKHGHAKVHLVATDVSHFSWPFLACILNEIDYFVDLHGKEACESCSFLSFSGGGVLADTLLQEDICPSTHNMDVPNVKREEYSLVNIDDGFLSLMTNDGATKDDVKLPEGDLGAQIQADFNAGKDLIVTILTAMGEEACIAFKEAPKGS